MKYIIISVIIVALETACAPIQSANVSGCGMRPLINSEIGQKVPHFGFSMQCSVG